MERFLRPLLAATATIVFSVAHAQTPSDACSFAAVSQYTVNSSCTYQDFDKLATHTADLAPTTCSGDNNGDAFGWFNATGTTTTVSFDPDNNHDALLHIYSGACGGLAAVTCSNIGGSGVTESVTFTTTVGLNYLVRIQRNGTNNAMNGRLCVWTPPPPPANDDPCGAVSLPVNVSCTNTSGTNALATATSGVPAPGCGTATTTDVWFAFVAPATGAVNINTTAGTLNDAVMALYSATACNGTFTLLACNDDNGADLMPFIGGTGLTPGQTYYIRVWGYGGGTGTFSICVTSTTPPTNDEPCAAIPLTLGTSCTGATFTNNGASITPSIPDPGCATVGSGDVWFSFVAPASGFTSFRTTAGTLTNTAMALYSAATCSSAMVLEDCDDNNGVGAASFLAFSDLVAGNTYYLRVWGVGGTIGTFDLCAYGPPTGSSCFYTLNLNDEIGDGWGGSTVGISVNGGAYTNYTVANGERDVIYFGVTTGQLIMMQYTSSGSGQSEISYILQLGGGQLYSAGPTPTTGLVYTGVVDCVAPAAGASDCRGASRLCGATAFNGSPSNTGLVADLNAQNRGCLATSERQGLWYYFIPSASGTFEFTVAPTNPADDYDFAVWGPFTSFDCHQKRAPLRCSYSGTPGNTGLLVGAGDDTEGSGGNKWVNAINGNLGEVFILYVSNYSRSGLSFGLTWTLTNGADLDCLVLPIELGGFEARPVGEEVDLSWWTASEQNNDRFIIERSQDAQTFLPIGTVAGAGNSVEALHYAWQDTDPLPGTSYYRLRQVDFDGQNSHSPIESVYFQRTTSTLTAFPNPANDIVHFAVEALQEGSCEIRILDAHGRIVLSQQASLAKGAGRVDIPVAELPPGQYIAQVIGPVEQGIITGRVVITR